MLITIELYATFQAGRFTRECRELPQLANVGQVIKALGLTDAEVGLILVNDLHAEIDRQLAHGDTLALFPMLGGG